MSDEIYGMADEPPRVIDGDEFLREHNEILSSASSKIEGLSVHAYPMEIGRHIIRAIAGYDEDLYDEIMCKHAAYPDEEDDKYHDGTANYDNDVDWGELHALIGALQYMSERYYSKSDVLIGGDVE
tara:strand:+ start:5984 stop:6361 length:378 start_codon:yes stop_codon:yes gene_type:complete